MTLPIRKAGKQIRQSGAATHHDKVKDPPVQAFELIAEHRRAQFKAR